MASSSPLRRRRRSQLQPQRARRVRLPSSPADLGGTMRINRSARLAAALATFFLTADLNAQQAPATMSLEDAIELARRYSPAFRQQANDEAVADWNVRAAYGSLLPSFSASTGVDWQA